MRTFTIIIIALTTQGCARAPLIDYDQFFDKAEAEVNAIPTITGSVAFKERVIGCNDMGKAKREACLADLEETTSAKIRVSNRTANREKTKDDYFAKRDDAIPAYMALNAKQIPGLKREVNEATARLQFFEKVTRVHEVESIALRRHSRYLNAVIANDEANARAWSSVAQTTNNLNQQTQLNRIENSQKQMQWQQKNDKYQREGGIMPR